MGSQSPAGPSLPDWSLPAGGQKLANEIPDQDASNSICTSVHHMCVVYCYTIMPAKLDRTQDPTILSPGSQPPRRGIAA